MASKKLEWEFFMEDLDNAYACVRGLLETVNTSENIEFDPEIYDELTKAVIALNTIYTIIDDD